MVIFVTIRILLGKNTNGGIKMKKKLLPFLCLAMTLLIQTTPAAIAPQNPIPSDDYQNEEGTDVDITEEGIDENTPAPCDIIPSGELY